MTEKLRPCPFCGGEARIQVTDDEGNLKSESYLKDPYSGIGYVIVHDTGNSSNCCPIATNLEETLGRYIYSSKQEAISAWNRRVDDNLGDLVEKETATTPDVEGDGYYKGELVYDTWICPRCGTRYEIGYDEYEYCPKCGQHIDLDSLEQECEDTEDEE
jgi:endogenous inhibitor of DNA gyrase (YacG/DUF329 family)